MLVDTARLQSLERVEEPCGSEQRSGRDHACRGTTGHRGGTVLLHLGQQAHVRNQQVGPLHEARAVGVAPSGAVWVDG